MGVGYKYICKKCSNCYYVSLGVGMMLPHVYQDTLEKVKNGKYGEEWKALAANNLYTAVNTELCVYKCEECDGWANEMDLSLYVPKDPEMIAGKTYGSWSVADHGNVPYADEDDLRKDYNLLRAYEHKCPKCGKAMEKLRSHTYDLDFTLQHLPCPECGETNIGVPLLWD